jgi:uncharacterized protein (DUF697 family)
MYSAHDYEDDYIHSPNDNFNEWPNDGVPQQAWGPGNGSLGWLEGLRNLWQWDDLAAEIGQESRARVAIVGQPAAGKRLLFNRLRGWSPAETVRQEEPAQEGWQAGLSPDLAGLSLESFGFFILADLPTHIPEPGSSSDSLLLALADPALVVYLLDAGQGVRAADYRWIATLRAGGRPLVIVLNNIDDIADVQGAVTDTERRIGMPVIPISAKTGTNVETRLLPALLDTAPRLAVPLGREILCLRRLAARRVIRQAALMAAMVGAQPAPVLDIPVQAMLQVGVVMRVGAAYGHAPSGGANREVMGTVVSTFGLRYLILSLVKLAPLLGWAVSGVMSSAMTLLIGEAAIHYYEAGATIPFRDWLRQRRPGSNEEEE